MGLKYECEVCGYNSSRRANLKRHYRLVHHQIVLSQDNYRNPNYKNYQKKLGNKEDNSGQSPLRWDEIWEYPQELAKFQNTIVNSKQTFDHIGNLRWQVNSLQQQLASFQNYFSSLMSHNMLVSKRSVQGLSGYLCEKCKTFGLKAIFDIGYDMTMRSRHQCNESPDKRDYHVIQIPLSTENRDLWVARVMADHLKSNTWIGNHLVSKEVTQGFTNYNKAFPPEITDKLLGIPDRYYLYSVEKQNRIDWFENVISNLGQKTFLTENQLIDFFIRARSTYAIFEFPSKEKMRRILVALTTY